LLKFYQEYQFDHYESLDRLILQILTKKNGLAKTCFKEHGLSRGVQHVSLKQKAKLF